MENKMWIRINGIGHAFSRELGCDCKRCTTVNFEMEEPPSTLREFNGWDDPPWRAHTSASILFPDECGNVRDHIIVDVGAGVVDSLVSSRLSGLENIKAILISHWHPDHVLGLNQLCESLNRTAKRKGDVFAKIPFYCTLYTYDKLRESGFGYELSKFMLFRQLENNIKTNITTGVDITPIEIAHGSVKGSVIYIVDIVSGSEKKKVIFCWDIDKTGAKRPSDEKLNIDIISELGNISVFENVDLLFMEANTINNPVKPTGHTSFEDAIQYIDKIAPKKVYFIHFSGHEDKDIGDGYGWTDSEWQSKIEGENKDYSIAKQGMLIECNTDT